jgi:hypothetical protein
MCILVFSKEALVGSRNGSLFITKSVGIVHEGLHLIPHYDLPMAKADLYF